MTRYVREPTTGREAAAGRWGVGDLRKRPGVGILSGGTSAIYEIKVFSDDALISAGDGAFEWEIPADLDGAQLVKVEGYVTTASLSGSVQVQIRRVGLGDMLTTKLFIDSGEKNSIDAATQPVIDTGNDVVAHGDHIAFDVDASGVDAQGLGMILTFTPSTLASVTINGAKGDPGGVTSWQGAWQSGVNYTTGQAVSNGGTSYVAITNSINIQPGVTSGWQTYWMVLAGGQQISEVGIDIIGLNYPLSVGLKGWRKIDFACTITEMTLLADQVGSVVIDIWKDTYGNYPPTPGDSIVGATPPTLSSAIKTTDTALVGWTTAIAAGDVLAFNVNSCSVITAVAMSLKVARA